MLFILDYRELDVGFLQDEVRVNERQLGRLLNRLVLLTAPLPLAFAGAACGGTSIADQLGTAGAGTAGTKDMGGGAGVSDTGGSGASGASGASGGASAGSVGVAGSAGMGGSIGESAGGVGGSSPGGSTGTSSCMGTMPGFFCGTNSVIVPTSCVDPTLAYVGTSLPLATCVAICGLHPAVTCSLAAVAADSVTVDCVGGCVTGRRPAGGGAPLLFQTRGTGSYFAELARLEAASVDAFRILRDELRAHGAPKKLVHAAARAARDEVRHTRAIGALARRFGVRPRNRAIEHGAPRAIEAIALENAVEGCVRETFGALLATWQARAARDPVVRAAMTRVARDETRHAALSWTVSRWLEQRLDREARGKVERARQAAVVEILRSAAIAAPSFSDLVGLPGAVISSLLATEMQRALWSPACSH